MEEGGTVSAPERAVSYRDSVNAYLSVAGFLEDLRSHVTCARDVERSAFYMSPIMMRPEMRLCRSRSQGENAPGVPQVVVSAENCCSSITLERPKSASSRSESSSLDR